MMSNARHIGLAPRAVCALVFACVLAACGATIGSVPEKLGGLPESAPQRPAETMPFPNVYEPRPRRQATPLNDDEQKKLESELTRLRDEQNQRANPPPPPPEPPKKTAVPVKKDPVPAKKAAAKETAPAPAKKKQNDAVVPEQKGPVAPPKLIN
jgi:hypothetical protein